MQDTALIANADDVISVVGFWPTFHDVEIIKFSLERAIPVKLGSIVAHMVVHFQQFAIEGAGTPQYQQVLIKNILIHFVFHGLSELEMSDFNHQNVVNSITIKQLCDTPALLVNLESIWGVGGSFRCIAAAVEAVEILPNELSEEI